jgi:hypothetical protein
MLKKTLSVVGLATALILGGSAAALADGYPVGVAVTASDTTPTVGQPITVTATGLDDYEGEEVTFATSGAGTTLSSIVLASGSITTVDKTVADGAASATFTASRAGTYTIAVLDANVELGEVTVTVAAAGGGSGGTGGTGALPATGSTVPGAVIWAGVGAIGLGGIAIAAVAARRRAAKN